MPTGGGDYRDRHPEEDPGLGRDADDCRNQKRTIEVRLIQFRTSSHHELRSADLGERGG